MDAGVGHWSSFESRGGTTTPLYAQIVQRGVLLYFLPETRYLATGYPSSASSASIFSRLSLERSNSTSTVFDSAEALTLATPSNSPSRFCMALTQCPQLMSGAWSDTCSKA